MLILLYKEKNNIFICEISPIRENGGPQFDIPMKWSFDISMPITLNKMYLTDVPCCDLLIAISQRYESRGVNYDELSRASDVGVVSEQLTL